jgi:hypothetical protein
VDRGERGGRLEEVVAQLVWSIAVGRRADRGRELGYGQPEGVFGRFVRRLAVA